MPAPQQLKLKLFLLIFIVYFFFSSGFPWIEALYQFEVAGSLCSDFSLGIFKKNFSYSVFNQGRWYDPHGLTNVFYFTPLVLGQLALKRIAHLNLAPEITLFLCSIWGIFAATAACVAFFSLLVRLKINLRVAICVTLLLAFFTLFFVYARIAYEGNLNTLFLLLVIYLLCTLRTQTRQSLFHSAGVGFFSGLMLNTRIELSLVLVFLISAYVIFLSFFYRRFFILLVYFLFLAPFLFLWGWYNYQRTGIWYLTPLMFTTLVMSRGIFSLQNIPEGLKGLFLSLGGSIFVFSPILLLSFLGWPRFFCRHKKESVFLASLIMICILSIATIRDWFGLFCWGPRYTLEITPLMMIPLAFWLAGFSKKNIFLKIGFLTLAGYSLLIQLAGVLVNWHARLLLRINTVGYNNFFFTLQDSQWLDALGTLFVNIWNLFFSWLYQLPVSGYEPAISPATRFQSETLFVWWARAIYLGIPSYLIGIYLFLSIVLSAALFLSILRYASNARE